ncbi:MAG: hypothetical protein HYV63_03700 [Candidatus Schekmanbacteria bacterium]|nr:hypothetical protein [Candidatus Schekmanbacteria bacterium]
MIQTSKLVAIALSLVVLIGASTAVAIETEEEESCSSCVNLCSCYTIRHAETCRDLMDMIHSGVCGGKLGILDNSCSPIYGNGALLVDGLECPVSELHAIVEACPDLVVTRRACPVFPLNACQAPAECPDGSPAGARYTICESEL